VTSYKQLRLLCLLTAAPLGSLPDWVRSEDNGQTVDSTALRRNARSPLFRWA